MSSNKLYIALISSSYHYVYLAEGPAGVDGPLQADGGEEGAEEELRVGVALDVQQGDPAHALLGHLVQSVVLHQVGQPHLGVA